jgi:WD40 repeat protein
VIKEELGGAIEAASLAVTQVEYSSRGGYLAVAGCDQAMIDADDLKALPFPGCQDTISGKTANAFLFILDTSTGEVIASLPPTGMQTTVQCMDFSHDGQVLAYGLTTGQLVIWDIAAGRIESEIPQPPAEADWWPHCSAFSPDDRLMAANYGTATKIWERATETFVAQIDEPQWPYLRFSEDGKTLLVETPPITTYSTDTWQKLSSIWGEDGFYPYWAVADSSPDLTLYADAEINISEEFENGPVRVYDLKTGELLQTLEGTWNGAGWILFTPDGRYLLRIDDTGRGLVVWQVDGWNYSDESSVLADKISPDDHFIRRLIFSSDGRSFFVWTYARLALYGLP